MHSRALTLSSAPNTQHRVKVGELLRSDASLAKDGVNVKAVWRPGRSSLAVLVCASPTLPLSCLL